MNLKILILLLFAFVSIHAQGVYIYTAICSGTLVSSATTLTVQLPENSSKQVNILSWYATTSVTSTVTATRTGTAASGSTTATIGTSNSFPTSTAKLYCASNAGTGSTVGAPVSTASPVTVPMIVSGLSSINPQAVILTQLAANNATLVDNFNLSLASMSGTYTLAIVFAENATITSWPNNVDTDDLGSGATATCTFPSGIPVVAITYPGSHYRVVTPATVNISGTGGSGTSLHVLVTPSDVGPVPITLFAGVAP